MRIQGAIRMSGPARSSFRQFRPGPAEPIMRDLNSSNFAAKAAKNLPMSPIRSLAMHGFEFRDYPFSATRFVAIQATAQRPAFPIGFRHTPRDGRRRRPTPEGGTGAPTSCRVAISASAKACFACQRRHVPISPISRTVGPIGESFVPCAIFLPMLANRQERQHSVRARPTQYVHYMFQISVCRRRSCRLYAGKHSKRPAGRGGRRMR